MFVMIENLCTIYMIINVKKLKIFKKKKNFGKMIVIVKLELSYPYPHLLLYRLLQTWIIFN